MKRLVQKVILGMVALVLGGWLAVAPAWAACTQAQLDSGCVDTALLGSNGCSCKSGETAEDGAGIENVLNLVVRIMSVGVGILGAIGITIVGIQYLTAGGSEEQTRKAKRRMFEIVLGLAFYVVAYALLSWLLPDFRPFG